MLGNYQMHLLSSVYTSYLMENPIKAFDIFKKLERVSKDRELSKNL